MHSEIYHLSEQLGRALLQKSATVTSAESCTGGGVAQAITEVAGSSSWFKRSYVTYANSAKQEMLGVDAALLDEHGAVSEPVVISMAKGAALRASADYAVAISGIAGPGGGSQDKPVGTVWFAWLSPEGVLTQKHLLSGDRHTVREQAVKISLQELLHQLTGCNTV
ncbi:MAG: nicotinamide-nucleotide amidase [Porticoccaceae bacterium]